MKKIDVSILVPVFNGQKFIGRCLRSLNRQVTDLNYEIVVVDDGSTDLTSYAIGQFGRDVKTITHKHNLGLPAALNSGLKVAKGEYFVRVDADDFVNKWFIQFLYEFLTRNSHLDAVACDYLLVDENEAVLSRENAEQSPIACGLMFKTNQVLALGGYDESFRYLEDKEFRTRFDKKFNSGYLEIPLYRYRRHRANLTNNVEEMERYRKRLNH
jgi:glycosyltransferase involved in cell wall biosynthesis